MNSLWWFCTSFCLPFYLSSFLSTLSYPSVSLSSSVVILESNVYLASQSINTALAGRIPVGCSATIVRGKGGKGERSSWIASFHILVSVVRHLYSWRCNMIHTGNMQNISRFFCTAWFLWKPASKVSLKMTVTKDSQEGQPDHIHTYCTKDSSCVSATTFGMGSWSTVST